MEAYGALMEAPFYDSIVFKKTQVPRFKLSPWLKPTPTLLSFASLRYLYQVLSQAGILLFDLYITPLAKQSSLPRIDLTCIHFDVNCTWHEQSYLFIEWEL